MDWDRYKLIGEAEEVTGRLAQDLPVFSDLKCSELLRRYGKSL